MNNAPQWARHQQNDRVTTKAAHLVALLEAQGEIGDIPKTRIAAALGISRWTLDRYLADLPEVKAHLRRIREAIEAERSNYQ